MKNRKLGRWIALLCVAGVIALIVILGRGASNYRAKYEGVDLTADISGIGRSTKGTIILSFDGRTHEFSNVEYVEITQSDKEVHLIRNPDYDYWQKLSSKLL